MIGTKCIDVVDETRKEKLSQGDENRRITVRFYYPGIGDSDRKPDVILTASKLSAYGTDPELTFAYNRRVKLYKDLPVQEGCYPLILFSHGFSSSAESNSDLCMSLAKHGYIVASVSHTYEARETVFEDGTVVSFDRSLYKKMMDPALPGTFDQIRIVKMKMKKEKALEAFDKHQRKYSPYLMERIPEWAEDDRLAIRKIHEMAEDEGSFLYHKVDFSHGIGVSGHSFGGAAAYYHCLYDDEVVCGVNIDGGLFGDYDQEVNHKPFMSIVGENLNVVTRSLMYHDRPVHLLIFKDTKHFGFCDMKLLSRNVKRTGKSDPIKMMDTLNEAHCAFFDRYLKQADTDNRQALDISRDVLTKYEVC